MVCEEVVVLGLFYCGVATGNGGIATAVKDQEDEAWVSHQKETMGNVCSLSIATDNVVTRCLDCTGRPAKYVWVFFNFVTINNPLYLYDVVDDCRNILLEPAIDGMLLIVGPQVEDENPVLSVPCYDGG
ncbi:hypothetical protein L1049_004288 [Liquidambar formosana]|uniref:Uncharacterized protein n=1 Tax=Liquidambar formosana TaxID=63359 RepID=A0AAP0RNS1_LIQFO